MVGITICDLLCEVFCSLTSAMFKLMLHASDTHHGSTVFMKQRKMPKPRDYRSVVVKVFKCLRT